MATFIVPQQFVGKSLSDLRRDPAFSQVPFEPGLFGVDPNTKLTSGQKITFRDDPGSAEFQFLQSRFTPQEQFQAQQQQAFTEAQRGRENEFLGRVQGIPNALTALESELGIPEARQTFQQAGETARTVAGAVRDVAPTQQTIAKQVGISAPRLQRRTAAGIAELAPSVESSTRGLESAQAGLESLLGSFGARSGGILSAFDIEAGVLGDSVKNEYDLFKTNIQANLDRELEQLKQTGLNDRAALDRAARLAEIEKAAIQGNFQDLGNRVIMVDPTTGKEIASFNKGLAPSRTGSFDNWEGA